MLCITLILTETEVDEFVNNPKKNLNMDNIHININKHCFAIHLQCTIHCIRYEIEY